ncbi:MAG TPA: insulinase family protein [Rhabdochlamydiaceae bacterium]|nr:insulinase family protein [Rhabdochlamydiaceae bacterium]
MKLFFSIVACTCCCLLLTVSKVEGSVHLFRSNFQDKSFITISYTTPLQTSLRKDLKEFWKQFLFYSLLQQRLQQSLTSEGVQYTYYQQAFSKEPNSYTISVSCPSDQVVAALSEICHQIEQVKRSGFSEKEFKDIKEKAYLGLCKLEGQYSKEMAQLISNDISNENTSPNLNVILESSKELIEMATLSEVSEYSHTQIIDASREIDVVVPNEESFISENELCQILEEQKWNPEQQTSIAASSTIVQVLKNEANHPLLEEETLDEARPQFEEISYKLIANEIEQPVMQTQPQAELLQPLTQENAAPVPENMIDYYSTLPISHEEKMMISKLIVTLAENNVFKLLFEKKKLEKLGKRINHIHPMKFLGTILLDPRLSHCLREIKKSSFKWENFMGGLVRRMDEEFSHDNLRKYIPGFCSTVQANPDQLVTYIEKKDFEGMIISLL